MRAVIRRNGKLVVDEMTLPPPGQGQLLTRVLVCGICGSDLHALDHYDHMIDLTAGMGGVSQMRKGEDTVFGHEFCCEVLENGPGTAGAFKAGDHALAESILSKVLDTRGVEDYLDEEVAILAEIWKGKGELKKGQQLMLESLKQINRLRRKPQSMPAHACRPDTRWGPHFPRAYIRSFGISRPPCLLS